MTLSESREAIPLEATIGVCDIKVSGVRGEIRALGLGVGGVCKPHRLTQLASSWCSCSGSNEHALWSYIHLP